MLECVATYVLVADMLDAGLGSILSAVAQIDRNVKGIRERGTALLGYSDADLNSFLRLEGDGRTESSAVQRGVWTVMYPLEPSGS